jgi:hypothetical protein
MDAVKYLEELHRMCSKQNVCYDCPIYKATKRNCGMAYSNAEMLAGHIGIVEQWAKEHPVETRQSRFLKEFPNAMRTKEGAIRICPKCVDTGMKCWDAGCEECEQKYWSEEIHDE